MKSARERAEEAYYEASDAYNREGAVQAIARLFEEHADCQRQNCGENVDSAARADEWGTVEEARTRLVVAAVGAPAPGEPCP